MRQWGTPWPGLSEKPPFTRTQPFPCQQDLRWERPPSFFFFQPAPLLQSLSEKEGLVAGIWEGTGCGRRAAEEFVIVLVKRWKRFWAPCSRRQEIIITRGWRWVCNFHPPFTPAAHQSECIRAANDYWLLHFIIEITRILVINLHRWLHLTYSMYLSFCVCVYIIYFGSFFCMFYSLMSFIYVIYWCFLCLFCLDLFL